MLGEIIGDIVGSVYEFDNTKRTDFPFFSDRCSYTDDSIMTVAVRSSCGCRKILRSSLVTRIGCGIAGFRDEQMAPLFADALELPNVVLPKSFVIVIK